jgi:hypothetical protein
MKTPSLSHLFNVVIENLVFFVAAVVLFFKTSELLTTFAPQTILGYKNLGGLYGMVCALLVEGLLAVTKWSLDKKDNSMAWAYKILLLIVTFLISATAQVVDGLMIRDTLSQQPPIIQGIVLWGVPLVPSLILALAAGKAVFENIPPSVLADMAQKTANINAMPKKVFASDTNLASLQRENEASQENGHSATRKNYLTTADKDFIATANVRQIMAKYGCSARTARDWRQAAKGGRL